MSKIERLEKIGDTYAHVYLSPHLDDAILSCGGTIARQAASGERVLVVAICTAAPRPEGPFNAIAQELHNTWGLDPAEVVTARLREDSLAMEMVGADSYHAGMLDAIYRYPDAYATRETLFGTPAADDPLWQQLRLFVSDLCDRTPRAKIYAPLAIGDHVDHQITFAVARDSRPGADAFYEDFPYAAKPRAVESRLQTLKLVLTPVNTDISDTINRKISAIAAYSSQLQELFGGAGAMAESVASFAGAISPGGCMERVWVRGN